MRTDPRPMILCPTVPVVLLVSLTVAFAQSLEPDTLQGERVARLVRQLGSDSYEQRQQAQAVLDRVGPDGRAQLTTALRDDDAEVRLRAGQLLRQLDVARLWAASPVEPPLKNGTVSELVTALAERTGNRVCLGAALGRFEKRRLTLDSADQEFWPALDDVCRRSRSHIEPSYNPREPGLVLVSGSADQQPVAYCGPVRARVTSARRVFSERLEYGTERSETSHTFQINVKVMWEERLRLLAYRSEPVLVSAVTNRGESVGSARRGGNAWNVTSQAVRQLSAAVRLQPPSIEAEQLDHLELAWELLAVGDMQTLNVDDPRSQREINHHDLVLSIEELGEDPSGQFLLTVRVARDLVVPEPAEVLLHENRLELYDDAGQQFSRLSQTASLVEHGVRIKARFRAPSGGSRPGRLRLLYPGIRDRRAVAISFRNVPLPTARPE